MALDVHSSALAMAPGLGACKVASACSMAFGEFDCDSEGDPDGAVRCAGGGGGGGVVGGGCNGRGVIIMMTHAATHNSCNDAMNTMRHLPRPRFCASLQARGR